MRLTEVIAIYIFLNIQYSISIARDLVTDVSNLKRFVESDNVQNVIPTIFDLLFAKERTNSDLWQWQAQTLVYKYTLNLYCDSKNLYEQ